MRILGNLKNSITTPPTAWRDDGDGRIWVKATAHGNLTAKTMYMLLYDATGYVTKALTAGVLTYRVVVPLAAVSSGEDAWMVAAGPIEDCITANLDMTAGHAFIMNNGALTDAGAAPAGTAGECAVCLTTDAAGAVAVHDLMLFGELITPGA